MGSASPNGMKNFLPGAGTSYAVQTNEMANASVDSTVLAPSLVQFASIALTAAQILALFVTPVQLVAAPGVGKSLILDSWMMRFTAGGTQFAAGGAVGVQFGSVGSGGGTAIGNTLAAAVMTSASNSDTLVVIGNTNITLTQNTGLFLSNATASFTTGNGTALLQIWYSVF